MHYFSHCEYYIILCENWINFFTLVGNCLKPKNNNTMWFPDVHIPTWFGKGSYYTGRFMCTINSCNLCSHIIRYRVARCRVVIPLVIKYISRLKDILNTWLVWYKVSSSLPPAKVQLKKGMRMFIWNTLIKNTKSLNKGHKNILIKNTARSKTSRI